MITDRSAHIATRKRVPHKRGTILAAGIVAVIAMLATVATAGAGTVTREKFVNPFTEPAVDDCRPDVSGTVSGTDVIDVQGVETDNGFHLKGTSAGTGRID